MKLLIKAVRHPPQLNALPTTGRNAMVESVTCSCDLPQYRKIPSAMKSSTETLGAIVRGSGMFPRSFDRPRFGSGDDST